MIKKINIENFTLDDLLKTMEDTHANNDYFAVDIGGVTAVVAKGDAARKIKRTLDLIDKNFRART